MVALLVAVLVAGTLLIVLSIVDVLPGIALLVVGLVAALAVGDRLDRDRRGPRDQAASFDAGRGSVPTASTLTMPSVASGSRYDDMAADAAGTVPPQDEPSRD